MSRKLRERSAAEIAKTAISTPTTAPSISNPPNQALQESTVNPVPTVLAAPATVSYPPQVSGGGSTVMAWFVVLPILAGLAYLAYRTSSFHPMNAGTQENASNAEPGQQKSFLIDHDPEQFRLASELWNRNREIFTMRDSERLAELETKLKQHRPFSGLGCLGFIIGAIVIGSAHGAGAGWGIIIVGVCVVGVIGHFEEKVQRWRNRDQLTRRLFAEPEPIFQERHYQEQPPRQQAPPPRQKAPPPRQQPPPPKTNEIRITSLQQAFEILELPRGTVTLSAARMAYKQRMLEYHPDRTAHLGHELRELAARKALEINLAWKFVQEHCK